MISKEIQTASSVLAPPLSTKNPLDTATSFKTVQMQKRTITEQGQSEMVIRAGTPEDAKSALSEYRALMAPAPVDAIKLALAALHMRKDSEWVRGAALTSTLTAYLVVIQNLPGDILLEKLNSWAEDRFPTDTKIKDAVLGDLRVIRRRYIIKALEAFIKNGPEKVPKKYTDEERARMADAAKARHLAAQAERAAGRPDPHRP